VTGVALRLLTYNVHGLRDDQRALVEVVRAAEPDVVVLQEAPGRFRWRTRCAILARKLGMVYAAGGGPSVGNLILTTHRVAVHDVWHLRYPLTPGRHLRGAAFARVSVGTSAFVVAGSHLSIDATERVAQAQRLRRAVDEAAERGAPVLLAADVNAAPDEPSWLALAAGLVDAGAAVGVATFPARDPHRRIDGIFVDPRVRVDACRVLDTPDARLASDHLPILAELTLPPAGAEDMAAAPAEVADRPAR
jgi:endonuclease/exonuclease/phosphatase family metal-dependent hydrolase